MADSAVASGSEEVGEAAAVAAVGGLVVGMDSAEVGKAVEDLVEAAPEKVGWEVVEEALEKVAEAERAQHSTAAFGCLANIPHAMVARSSVHS